MRYLKLQTNENTNIEIHNDWTGKEKVFYNGKLVSEERSFFGHKHTFSVDELGYLVNYEVNIFMHLMGVGFEIKRNGVEVMSNKPSSSSNSDKSAWTVAAIVILFIAGLGMGYGIVREDNTLIVSALGILGLTYIAKAISQKYLNSSKP